MADQGKDSAYPPPPPAYQPMQPAYGQPVQPAYGQPGQPAYGQHGQPPPYGHPQVQPQSTTTVVVAQPMARAPGACAFCGGFIRERYSIAGIILAILCFPWGVICCFMMTERRCTQCGR